MIAYLVSALAFAPLAPSVSSSSSHVTSRVRQPVALLGEASNLLASAASIVPPGFEDLIATPAKPKFGSMMLELAGMYILMSGAASFVPLLKKRVEMPDPSQRIINYLESGVPEASFGWHQVDLRTPLPPLDELTEHPIGIHSGKKAYLCRESAAVDYYKETVTSGSPPSIEVSPVFTEHYGERLYICYK